MKLTSPGRCAPPLHRPAFAVHRVALYLLVAAAAIDRFLG